MKRYRLRGRSTRPHDEGFTTVEILVSIALLGVLLLVVWSAVSSGMRVVSRITVRIFRNNELMRLDTTIRDSVERIHTPYWAKGIRTEDAVGSVRVYDLDGLPDSALIVQNEDSGLSIGDGKNKALFSTTKATQIEVKKTNDSGSMALEVEAKLGGAEDVSIVAPLPTVPFPLIE
jgi:hypothetical protein